MCCLNLNSVKPDVCINGIVVYIESANLLNCHVNYVSFYIYFNDVNIVFGSLNIDIRYSFLCHQMQRFRCLDWILQFLNRYQQCKH